MVDVVGLKSLQVLARCGSVALTAEELGFTPSAVSQQLKKLQAQVGVELVERQGRGVVLTAQGVALADQAQLVFDALDSATNAARRSTTQPRGSVRVGAFATACRGLLTPAMVRLCDSAPDVEVSGHETNPGLCVQLVARGVLDIGIVHDWDRVPLHLPDGVNSELLGYDTASVLAPSSSPLAEYTRVTVSDLVNLPWVTHQGIEVCRAMFQQLFSEAPHLPRIVFEADEYATQYALVKAGLAYAIFPRLALGENLPGTVTIALQPNPPRRGVLVVWRRQMSGSGALLTVRDTLKQVACGVLEST